MGLYPKGEYPGTNSEFRCGNYHSMSGATCIIDNKHPGRRHWGPDSEGNYREWAQAGADRSLTSEKERG